MRVGIVGHGAIGSLLALRCAQQGIKFRLLTRNGKHRHWLAEDIIGTRISVHANASLLSEVSDLDIIILPLKAYQILDALGQLVHHVTPAQTIVLMHNGMGTAEPARQLLPQVPLLVATTSYGAFKPQQDHLRVTGIGQTALGWLQHADIEREHIITGLFSALLPPCELCPDVKRILWNKLAVNAVINPLTALGQIKNGELAGAEFTDIKHTLCNEVATVMDADGYPVTTESLLTLVNQVIADTANNRSSMAQDIALGRRTEIDYINGYVCQRGEHYRVDTPANQSLWDKVKAREKREAE